MNRIEDATGRDHWIWGARCLDRILDQVDQHDAAWVQAWATVALAHATLAAAARDYGLHVPAEMPQYPGAFKTCCDRPGPHEGACRHN